MSGWLEVESGGELGPADHTERNGDLAADRDLETVGGGGGDFDQGFLGGDGADHQGTRAGCSPVPGPSPGPASGPWRRGRCGPSRHPGPGSADEDHVARFRRGVGGGGQEEGGGGLTGGQAGAGLAASPAGRPGADSSMSPAKPSCRKAITLHRQRFAAARGGGPEVDLPVVVVAARGGLGKGGEGEPLGISCWICTRQGRRGVARTIPEQVANEDAIVAVFGGLDRRRGVAMARFEIASAGAVLGVAEFEDVGGLGFPAGVAGEALHHARRIGVRTGTIGDDLDPPDLALPRGDVSRVRRGGGEEERGLAGRSDGDELGGGRRFGPEDRVGRGARRSRDGVSGREKSPGHLNAPSARLAAAGLPPKAGAPDPERAEGGATIVIRSCWRAVPSRPVTARGLAVANGARTGRPRSSRRRGGHWGRRNRRGARCRPPTEEELLAPAERLVVEFQEERAVDGGGEIEERLAPGNGQFVPGRIGDGEFRKQPRVEVAGLDADEEALARSRLESEPEHVVGRGAAVDDGVERQVKGGGRRGMGAGDGEFGFGSDRERARVGDAEAAG